LLIDSNFLNLSIIFSSLRGLIEKPPVCGKELHPLNSLQVSIVKTFFRLFGGDAKEARQFVNDKFFQESLIFAGMVRHCMVLSEPFSYSRIFNSPVNSCQGKFPAFAALQVTKKWKFITLDIRSSDFVFIQVHIKTSALKKLNIYHDFQGCHIPFVIHILTFARKPLKR
jgi:hypothetical protein